MASSTARLRESFIPRRVLIAPDKFKGTLTSEAAARAIERGLKRAWPAVVTTRVILSDGGEGFAETMVAQTGGPACGDRGRPTRWGSPARRDGAFSATAPRR